MEDLKSFDLEISDEVFFLFSELIYRTSGIKLTLVKKGLLIARLLKRLKLLGIKGFYDYYHRVKSDDLELVEMLNCISTNTTTFFRENHHFEYLRNIVVPEFLKKKRERTLRIWSAGCSTGEEPYSIAVALLEALRLHTLQPENWDIRILATDISTKALETAETGIYEAEQLPEDLATDLAKRYFLRGIGEDAGKIRVKEPVRDLVVFRRLNLKDRELPFRRTFDAVFCRNVMIYFDEGMKRHVLSLFHRNVSHAGYLFLGHSETIIDKEEFKPVYITVYKKI
ncbi:MAG: protein-glutamate O-methyltransferase CheR [Thermodesulfovibrionales bacterium]|jgi:chemotaxis protein methyltransferase CheR